MCTAVKTGRPTHITQRLIMVLNNRRKVLDRPIACGRCCLELRLGCEVTAVRDEGELVLVHDGCTGWSQPLSADELEQAFDEIFGATAKQKRRKRRQPR